MPTLTVAPPRVFGFLSPRPRRLAVDRTIPYPLTYATDVTGGAPQRLFRHLRDSLVRFGFVPFAEIEPAIMGQAIGETGTTEGWLFGERSLEDVKSPFQALRALGVIFVVIALFLFLMGLTSTVNQLIWLWLLAILVAGIGAALLQSHQFISELVYVHLKGEVYGSGLAVGTRLPAEVADSHRRSVISEVRLSIYGTGIRSQNRSNLRRILSVYSSQTMKGGFQAILDDLASNILPKVVLQKSWEQTRQEYSAPVIERHVVHEVLVKCGYCGGLNPQGTRNCGNCGATLV